MFAWFYDWYKLFYVWIAKCKTTVKEKHFKPYERVYVPLNPREKVFDENDLDNLNDIFRYGKKKQ